MTDALRYDGKVALITGAGNGLGRAHALLLASRGAQVVVNDLGGGATGGGHSSAAADRVVAEIKAAGGQAVANYDSVEDGGKIVQCALDSFGRVDIVVNNAGILRDSSFLKMTEADWDLIMRVHVQGAFKVTHAAWPRLREQGYGRVIFTASAAGIYGNFGQANYSAAKLGLAALGFTLAAEGRKYNIRVNTIAPIAGSRLTETILPKEVVDALRPEYVSPLVAYLAHDGCEETGGLFEVGGGYFGKLRWERTVGQLFRLGRDITPELVARHWPTIVDFGATTHPQDVTQALQVVLDNVNAGASKGGNEFIDVDQALGYEFPPIKTTYDERDLSLYALGVGAAADPLDDDELRYVYEMHGKGFTALPTYAVIPALTGVMNAFRDGQAAPGLHYGLERLLHGEQYTELKRPLPPSAKLTHRTWVKDIFDKGKNAFVVMAVETTDDTGEVLAYNELGSIIRGAGGWGGERGPSSDVNTPPDRAPDFTRSEKIGDNQALLYRLSGDWNPLHVDPAFAGNFGFPKPILHGLCTYGYAARHVLAATGVHPGKFKSIKVRFADSVYPGETLVTEIWRVSDTRVIIRCKVAERDKVVLSNSAVEFYSEVPNTAPKAALKPAPSPADVATPATPNSHDVFTAIGQFLQKSPEVAAKAGAVFQFKLTDPASVWTVDCKANGVAQGETAAPECTLELSDADFMLMCSGKADPQQLYMSGKLKIGGNLMASMKLNFLKKLDPALVMQVMRGRVGAAAAGEVVPAASAEPKPAPAHAPRPAQMPALAERLASKLAALKPTRPATLELRVNDPDSTWSLALSPDLAALRSGPADQPTATVTIADDDLAALIHGKATMQSLFQRGKLRVDGDVLAAHQLSILEGALS